MEGKCNGCRWSARKDSEPTRPSVVFSRRSRLRVVRSTFSARVARAAELGRDAAGRRCKFIITTVRVCDKTRRAHNETRPAGYVIRPRDRFRSEGAALFFFSLRIFRRPCSGSLYPVPVVSLPPFQVFRIVKHNTFARPLRRTPNFPSVPLQRVILLCRVRAGRCALFIFAREQHQVRNVMQQQ